MRREALAFIAGALVACTDFAALDDHVAVEMQSTGGAAAAGAGAGSIPSSDEVSRPPTGGASNPAPMPMIGTEGGPPIVGIGSGGATSVAAPTEVPRDAGAASDESGPGSLADAGPEPSSPPEPAPPSGSVRFVALVADSEVRGSDVACISDFNLLGPDGSLLDRALWRASADSAEPNYVGGAPAAQAIDDDRLSLWHTAWYELDDPPGYPHFLMVDLGAFVQVAGFRYLPRQDSSSGRIAAYRFFASTNAELGAPLASGVFPNTADEQTVLLPAD